MFGSSERISSQEDFKPSIENIISGLNFSEPLHAVFTLFVIYENKKSSKLVFSEIHKDTVLTVLQKLYSQEGFDSNYGLNELFQTGAVEIHKQTVIRIKAEWYEEFYRPWSHLQTVQRGDQVEVMDRSLQALNSSYPDRTHTTLSTHDELIANLAIEYSLLSPLAQSVVSFLEDIGGADTDEIFSGLLKITLRNLKKMHSSNPNTQTLDGYREALQQLVNAGALSVQAKNGVSYYRLTPLWRDFMAIQQDYDRHIRR
jgi:hypothetical protein